MGYGDDLMVTSLAANAKRKYPNKQIIIGNAKKKQAYHSIVYDNNPSISDCRNLDFNKPIHMIDYHPGNRPYINYEMSKKYGKYIWNINFKPTPGAIFFSKEEKNNAKIILENAVEYWKKKNKKKYKAIIFLETSSTKINDMQFGIKHQNKDWGWKNWCKLTEQIKNEFLIIQPRHKDTKILEDIYTTNNINFREACAILNLCDFYLGNEGGFGHASAALGKKAIIYFGGWIDPKIIGYSFHDNIYFNSKESPCGEFKKFCDHCERARVNVTVKFLAERVRNIL